MTFMNAHSLFVGSHEIAAYHQAIAPCPIAHAKLVSADKKIRKTLRAASGQLLLMTSQLEALVTRHFIKDYGKPTFDVRFLWQGSKVYKTDIDPALKPPQQTDLDDGVYLKTSFFSNTDPAIASEKFFQFVEKTLQPLCDAEGWSLIQKDTCIRIQIASDLHIDLPLYAIPDDEFSKLEKATMRSFGADISVYDGKILSLLDAERSLRIDSNRVMLAHREKGWIVSDPRALHDWFECEVKQYGPQLRRMCRYLKGWRDFAFKSNGPESITLMVCSVLVFQEKWFDFDENRDDKTFLLITERLPELFSSKIYNPVLPGDNNCLNNWDSNTQKAYIDAANILHQRADSALNGTGVQQVTVDRFIECLGNRFPQRPDLVKVESKLEVKSATVLTTPAPLSPAIATTSG